MRAAIRTVSLGISLKFLIGSFFSQRASIYSKDCPRAACPRWAKIGATMFLAPAYQGWSDLRSIVAPSCCSSPYHLRPSGHIAVLQL